MGGWQIAANNQDSGRVIASFPWGTYGVVMAEGASICTAKGSPGSNCGANGLLMNGNTFKPRDCDRRILLSRPFPVPVQLNPAGMTSYAHFPNTTADYNWPPRADDWVVVCGSSRAGAPVLVNGVVRARFVLSKTFCLSKVQSRGIHLFDAFCLLQHLGWA